MNSLCIKSNDDDILKYLQNEFSSFNMQNIFFSCNEFKSYKNIIIHYSGIDTELFYSKLATIFSYLVIDNFENDIIKNILMSNYFYFNKSEFSKILDLCYDNICNDDDFSFQNRQIALFESFYEYISTHHSIVLSGFINFRLFEYRKILENLVDFSVNQFIIEREYLEFISLLKLYINSQPMSNTSIHVVCLDSDSFLLNENMENINLDKKALNAKYLSDVSFSHNDYVLNTLLNILPNKIYIHLASPNSNLDFIHTLQLIFEERIQICNDCNICNLYKNLNINQKK